MTYLKNVCAPNKAEDLNLSGFSIITGINESKTLIKHISCNIDVDLMEENVIHMNSRIKINVDDSVTNVMYMKKIVI